MPVLQAAYGLLINADPSSAPPGVPVTLNQLNGGSASAQGEEAMPPETEIVEGATAASNGVALDGLPIDAPIDGVPVTAAEVADRDVDVEVAIANANAAANGEIFVETQEIIDEAANGIAPEPEGAFAAYFGDITRHPVMMGSAFAIGWLLARR